MPDHYVALVIGLLVRFCRDSGKICQTILMVDIKVKFCDSTQTATDINVEENALQQGDFNLRKVYQLHIIP